MYGSGGWGVLRRALSMLVLFTLSGGHPPSSPVAIPPVPSPPISGSPAGPLLPIPASDLSLAGAWRFAVDPEAAGHVRGWAEPIFDDSTWEVVTVPHTWNVMAAYHSYEGIAWYRRRFSLPPLARHAHLRLRFEAVFYRAQIWLNGIYVGEHEGGYTPFAFDVSGVARADAENVLTVRVDNRRAVDRLPATLRPDWSFDWWNYGGIVRHVFLHLSSRAFIAAQRLVALPHLTAVDQADTATVTATVTIRNASALHLEGALTGDILEETRARSVLSTPLSAPVSLPPGGSAAIQLTATLGQPRLWHFDHPHLYRWSAALRDRNGQRLHTAAVTFGIRTVELRGARLYLNGEPVRLVGVTRHADSPEHGLAEPVTVMAADYADLKRLNAVLSRPVHYPQAEFILEYADRHGLLLIPEIPAWQLSAGHMADPRIRALARQHLREMMLAQFNHPSVWAWSVGNELESKTAAGHEFIREMVAFVKALDPRRPVGFASRELRSRPEADATAWADFVLMNEYFGTWDGPKDRLAPALDAVHATWPDKAVIISEYGFEPHWERITAPGATDPAQYYFLPEETPADAEAADLPRRQMIAEHLAVFRRKPFVAGAIFWTYQDYRTPTGYQMGVVNAQRQRRGSWEVLREANAPVVVDAVRFVPRSGRIRSASVVLRARGPVDSDMPAYTLRAYHFEWAVVAPDGQSALAQGRLPLPTLAPGTTWSGTVTWPAPAGDYRLTLRVMRPTGVAVLERTYDARGRLQR
jgi:beta-galactosidase/beta-glucuronidase